jgi:hypothetical protein
MWVAFLPVACAPSWQLAQVSVMPEWSNFAGFHAVVAWQLLQSAVVGRWFVVLPAAVVPLWQLAHVPSTCV